MKNTEKIEKASSLSSNKLLQIIECMAKNKTPMRLHELSKQVEMTQSTVMRYLQSLEDSHYVYQNEDLRYGLTWKICKLSEDVYNYPNLRAISYPFLTSMSTTLQLGTCLVINQDDECMYLDCIDTQNTLISTLQRIGKSAPLHATGSGKILLSIYSEAQIDEYIKKKGLASLTQYTITDRDKLIEELGRVRKRGYAIDEEECEIGLRCISFPLHDYTGKIIAGVSVFGSTIDVTDEKMKKEILPLLKQSTDTISKRLGYSKD